MKPYRWAAIAASAVVGFALLGLIVLAPQDRASGAADEFSRGELVIETASGPLRLDVEIAETQQQRSRGLMFRTSLEADSWMIFLYESPREITMWMKNTYVPLDMLFIAADGRILNIARDTAPLDLTPIPSAGPVRGVLEIRAGTAIKLGIKAGDRVSHRIFQ